MKKIVFVFWSLVCMLFLSTSVWANHVSFPISKEEIQKTVVAYDPGAMVVEDEGWEENQTLFSLFDENGEKIVLIHNVGEENKGLLQLFLVRNKESVSSFYDEEYKNILKLAFDLFGIEFIGDETWKEKLEIWEKEDAHMSIQCLPSYASSELIITMYNSQEYNPNNQVEKNMQN